MKTKSLIILLVLFAFLAGPAIAQTTTDDLTLSSPGGGKKLVYNELSLDSAGTVWSQEFSIADNWDYSYYTYPWHYKVDADAADSVNFVIYWYVLAGDTWIVADTIATVTSATPVKGTANLNNVKAENNKIKIVGTALYPAQTLDFEITQPRKNDNQ